MTDREIIEWVAQAQVGERLPSELLLHYGPRGAMQSIQRALESVGCPLVETGTPVDGPKVSAWARDWLGANPPARP